MVRKRRRHTTACKLRVALPEEAGLHLIGHEEEDVRGRHAELLDLGSPLSESSPEKEGEPGQDYEPNLYQEPYHADYDVDDDAVPDPDRQRQRVRLKIGDQALDRFPAGLPRWSVIVVKSIVIA